MKCALSSCKKPFTQTVPWQRYCRKQCADKASQLKRLRVMQAGRKAMKAAGA